MTHFHSVTLGTIANYIHKKNCRDVSKDLYVCMQLRIYDLLLGLLIDLLFR